MLMYMFSKVPKNNLLGISELREFPWNDDNDVQHNRVSESEIYDNDNYKVLQFNTIIDVGAAVTYTNVVSSYLAGTCCK